MTLHCIYIHVSTHNCYTWQCPVSIFPQCMCMYYLAYYVKDFACQIITFSILSKYFFWSSRDSFLLLIFAITANADPKFDGVLRNVSDGTMEAYMIPPFASNHASFIEPLPNGDLVMAWFSGTSEGESNVAIVFSHLKNNSDQWSKAQVVSQRKGYSNQNPVLFHDNKTDVLYLFHSQQEAKTASAGIQSEGWPLYIS